MNMINYDLFCCPTVYTVICIKSVKNNVLINWYRQNNSYIWSMLFDCYVLQVHVTGILQTLLVLILIQMHMVLEIL